MNNLKGKKIKLTKVTDKVFNGAHPNGIYVGNEYVGWCINGINIDQRCNIYQYDASVHKLDQYCVLSTSTVKDWDEKEMVITTQNSKYKVEEL